jgi:hypothetical protein
LVVPHPPTSRQEIQNQWIRDRQLDPSLYYPEGYMLELLEEWPVAGDLVVPVEAMPENLKNSMSDRWRNAKANQKVLEGQEKEEWPPSSGQPATGPPIEGGSALWGVSLVGSRGADGSGVTRSRHNVPIS